MAGHNVSRVSVIAHSFGTAIVAWILKNKFDLKFGRIIFCGSVVNYRFPFQIYSDRYEGNLVNEVGTRDFLPILAESVTWGYGSTGTFGFHRPRVFDRYHKDVSHSAFLNAKFCRKHWIPVLKGKKPLTSDNPESPPFYLRALSIIHLKYLMMLLLAGLLIFLVGRETVHTVDIPTNNVYFAGDRIDRLVAEAEEPCARWWPEFIQGRRCMSTTAMQGSVANLVVCGMRPRTFRYRDPTHALLMLEEQFAGCLRVDGVEDRRLQVQLDRTRVQQVKKDDGQSLWLCGCDEAGRQRVLEIANRRQ